MRAALQIAILAGLYFACDFAARALHSPLSGNVVGAIVLAVLLVTGVVPLRWVEEGADLLLKHLALLFVPASVLIMGVIPRVRNELPAVVAVMILTTFIGLTVAGLVAESAARRERDR